MCCLHSHFQHWFSLAVNWTPNTLVFISISTFIGSHLNSQALFALIDLPAIQLWSSAELQLCMQESLWQQLNSQTQYWIQEQMAAKKVLQEKAVQRMKTAMPTPFNWTRKCGSENENGYACSFRLNKKKQFREWKWLCLLLLTEQELLTREKNREFMCQFLFSFCSLSIIMPMNIYICIYTY